ncbi:MAG: prolyl-tRNA synthetase [Candidatus Woesearchaeota archaeon]|jgi:prolyl-tRNA synthetase
MDETGITVKKAENISEWYQQLMIKAGLADYSAVSGCLVFRPRSYAVWEVIQSETDKRFKKIGIQNAYFPLLIPESLLTKESKHIEGFAPEVAWVTQSGSSDMAERLAIRPTSETIMYDSYSKWIRSWRDLPLRLNQWNNVVRWEFKNPVPFLRTREFLWNEGHTAFATKEEAMAEGPQIIEAYEDVMHNYLALPTIRGRKTEFEKFAGAEYTISLECFLPSGKSIQGPDFHHDGQIFAKAFDIKFKNKQDEMEYAYQNTFAISTRVIGIMLMMHGDDKGVVMPPKVAQEQVRIIPLFFKGKEELVTQKAQELKSQLDSVARIEIDMDTEHNVGFRFGQCELEGIPLRVELGPRDIENNSCIVVRRDTGEKITLKLEELAQKIPELLDAIHTNLYQKADEFMQSNMVTVDNMDDFKKAIEEKKLVKALFCNDPNENWEDKIKEQTGADPRNIPENQEPVENGTCVISGKPAQYYCYFAKSY